jgi:hypothetical protein
MNLACNWLFTFRLGWGHRGLALSTGCVAVSNFLLLYALMRRHVSHMHTGLLAVLLAKVLLAGIALGAVCWAGDHWLLGEWQVQATLPKALALVATIATATAVFFAVAARLRITTGETGTSAKVVATSPSWLWSLFGFVPATRKVAVVPATVRSSASASICAANAGFRLAVSLIANSSSPVP